MCTSARRLCLPIFAASVFAAAAPMRAAVKTTDAPQTPPDAALRAYHSGNGLLNRGLYDLAADEYRAFLAAGPDHEKAPAARYGLAVCLFRQEKLADALAELEPLAALEDFEFAAEVGTMRGRCLLAAEQFDRAAEAFSAVLDANPRGPLALDAAIGLGEAHCRAQRYDDAAGALGRALDRRPDEPRRIRILYHLALAEMGRTQYASAAERLDDLLRADPDGPFADHATLLLAQCRHQLAAHDDAEALYRRAITRAVPHLLPDALLGLSNLLLERGRAHEAAPLLDRLLADHPQHPARPAWLLLRGRTHYETADYEAALLCFRRIAADDPLAAQAAWWSARCQLQSNDPTAAAATLASAAEAPASADLRPLMDYDRAVALLRTDHREEGADLLRAWLASFPEHEQAPEALYLLAATEHALARYDESRERCRAFLAAHPSHPRAAAVALLAAENDLQRSDEDAAAQQFARFLRKYPADPRAPLASFRLAMIHYRHERFDDAQPLLAELVSRLPDDAAYLPARLALGDIHFQRSEWKPAEEMLAAYVASGAADALDDALLKLALARQHQERFPAALEALDRLLAEFPDSPHRTQAHFERGQILLTLGDLDPAHGAFESVIAAAPASPFAAYARNHLGTIALRRNQPEQAARLFGEAAAADDLDAEASADALLQSARALLAAGRFAQAEQSLVQLLREHPAHPRADTARAHLAVAQSRLDKHDEALQSIETLSPALPRLEPALRHTVLYERAWCLRQLGRTQQAAHAWRALLEADPDHPHPHALLELADLESQQGRPDEAQRLLEQLVAAIEHDAAAAPPSVREQALYRLAVLRFERGQLEPAVALFERMIAAFPDSDMIASAEYFCGEALLRLGQPAAAADHLRRVVDRHAADPLCATSLLRLGEALAQLQRWPAGEEAFTTFLDRFPDSEFAWQARFGRAWACENQQRYDDAIALYRAVVDEHQGPTAARAQFQIGECLFARGQYDDAVREFLKVDILYAYPEWSAAALFEAARCFEKLGQAVEARDHFRKVAEDFKDTRWAAPAAQRLTQLASSSLPGR